MAAHSDDQSDVGDAAARPGRARFEPWTEVQQLAYEKEALGLYFSGHPIDRVAAELKGSRRPKTIAELSETRATGPESENGATPANGANGSRRNGVAEVAVGGIIASVRPLKTRKGDRMAVVTLEDPHGSMEVVVFPEAFAKSASVLEAGAMVVVKGKVEVDEETTRMTASEVMPIEAMRQRMSREVSIKLTSPPMAARHSKRWPTSLRATGAIVVWCSNWSCEISSRPLRLRAGLAAQVRVRPSEQLASEAGAHLRCR